MAGFVPTRGFAAQGIACSRLRASPAFAGLVLSSRSSERPVLCQLSYAPTRQPYGTDMECLYNAIMADIEAFLTDHGIPFQRFDHPAVFTCEQAERIAPPIPGTAEDLPRRRAGCRITPRSRQRCRSCGRSDFRRSGVACGCGSLPPPCEHGDAGHSSLRHRGGSAGDRSPLPCTGCTVAEWLKKPKF